MPDDQAPLVPPPEPAPPEPTPEPVATPVPAPEPETAHLEPANGSNTPTEPITPEVVPAPEPPPVEAPTQPSPPIIPSSNPVARDLAAKARTVIQSRKRAKLDKIMEAITKHGSITNDQVEKLLHVSDATATRYLSQLEKEGLVKQEGKTGKSVKYQKV